MWDANGTANQRRSAHDAARVLGLQVQALDIRVADDFRRAIANAKNRKAEALVILASPAMTSRQSVRPGTVTPPPPRQEIASRILSSSAALPARGEGSYARTIR